MEQWKSWLREMGWIIAVGMVGLGLLGYGLWEVIKPREVVVEIIRNQEVGNSDKSGQVVVDVAGAVENPGVYRLQVGSRIGDALVAAGGVSGKADRNWISQNINLAKEIKDQEKIYIPVMTGTGNGATSQQTSESTKSQGKISINTASAGELDSLPGIGEVRVKAIIENRPYAQVEELVSKAKIPQSVYEDIVNLVSVY